MIPVLTAAQARAFDVFVRDQCSVPSLHLMENAGRAAADLLLARLPDAGARGARVVCVCGAGNNGGDGFVLARQLRARGREAVVIATAPRASLSHDARVNRDAWAGIGGELREHLDDDAPALGAPWRPGDVLVDALVGTGLSRPLTGRYRALVEVINATGAPVVALDVPSGLDADTGVVLGAAIRATLTITFGHPKAGLLTSLALDHTGELCVADLGVPQRLGPALSPRAEWLGAGDVAGWLVARARSMHKGRAGRVLVVGGAPGKTGAALLAASGALRAGAGLVTIGALAEATGSLDARVVEVMTRALDGDRPERALDAAFEQADAIVLGPGLGLDGWARRVVDHVAFSFAGPKLLDADAITHFAGRGAELARAAGPCLLTPHPGELGRLLGQSAGEIEADRYGALERACELVEQTVLLKGPHTLIGESGSVSWVVSEGHPALAVGGSGDVLSGITGALIAELGPRRAAALGAVVHGRAARLWVAAHGGADRGLFARELADHVPRALAELAAERSG